MRQHTMTLCSCLLLLILTLLSPSMAMDTITPAMPIKDGQTLVSSGGTFQLGYFSPSNSSNRYVGIWYKSIPDQIVVWVANRASPLGDLTGVLSIDSNGSLVLSDGASVIQWSSSSVNATGPVAQLLGSGNFVLKASSDPETFEWESFNDPRDTLLPGMKLGWNSRTGIDCYLTAWKRPDDPSPGDCSFRLEVRELPELYQYNGSQRIYASGCITWSDGLVDISQFQIGGQDLFIRLPASELHERTRISRKKSAALTIALSIASVLLLVGLVGYCSWKKRAKSNIMMSMWSSETRPMSLVLFSKKQTLLGNLAKNNNLYNEQSTGEVLELALFDVNTIMAATESFGMANKLGEGGFGRVYKGKLGDGQEVAVKSLSKDSLQGLDEFTNEVKIDR